jgi:hypothetical protein
MLMVHNIVVCKWRCWYTICTLLKYVVRCVDLSSRPDWPGTWCVSLSRCCAVLRSIPCMSVAKFAGVFEVYGQAGLLPVIITQCTLTRLGVGVQLCQQQRSMAGNMPASF